MNFHDLIAVAATIVVSLGGGGAIVYWFASLIGKILADKYIEKVKQEFQQELESHKARLRKSEFLFQKEFEAASAFISLRLRLMPRYRFAEMIWDDACEEFAHGFGGVEKALEAYIATHGAALQMETLTRIRHRFGISSSLLLVLDADWVAIPVVGRSALRSKGVRTVPGAFVAGSPGHIDLDCELRACAGLGVAPVFGQCGTEVVKLSGLTP